MVKNGIIFYVHGVYLLRVTNRSFSVKLLPDHRWNIVERYRLIPGKLEGVDVGKDHLMEGLVSDLKKDLREQGFGSQLVRSIASAPMPTNSGSANLSIAVITGSFASSVVNDWPMIGQASPGTSPPGCGGMVAQGGVGDDVKVAGLRRQSDSFFPPAWLLGSGSRPAA